MSATPETRGPDPGRRRRLIAAVTIIIIAVVIAALVAAYLFLFGSEAPPAPTIDEALKLLAPSPPPQ